MPPRLDVSFEFAAGLQGDLDAQAEFRAWLEGFKGHFSAILAARAKADLIVDASAKLVGAADGAVSGAVEVIIGEPNLKASFGAKCALEQLPIAASALASASGELKTNVEASAMLVTSISG